MTYNTILWIIGAIIIYFFIWLLYSPIKALFKFILNSAIGTAVLICINFIFSFVGFGIGVNIWTAGTIGILGIPGLCLLILLKTIL